MPSVPREFRSTPSPAAALSPWRRLLFNHQRARYFMNLRLGPRRQLRARCALGRRASGWCWDSSHQNQARWNGRARSESRIDEAAKFVAPARSALSRRNAALGRTRRGNMLAEGGAMGEAPHDRGNGRGSLGALTAQQLQQIPPSRRSDPPPRSVSTVPIIGWLRIGKRSAIARRQLCPAMRVRRNRKAAIPRRPRRTPAAPQALHEARANAPKGEIAAGPQGNPEDREIGASSRSRRMMSGSKRSPTVSSAVPGGISISSGPRWRREARHGSGVNRRRDDAERGVQVTGKLGMAEAASDGRAFSSSSPRIPADAEDHHSAPSAIYGRR